MRRLFTIGLCLTVGHFVTESRAGCGYTSYNSNYSYNSSYSAPSYTPTYEYPTAVAPAVQQVLIYPPYFFQYLPALNVTSTPVAPSVVPQQTMPQSTTMPSTATTGSREEIKSIIKEVLSELHPGSVDDAPVAIVDNQQEEQPQPSANAIPILAAKCAICHTEGSQTSGNVIILDESGNEHLSKNGVQLSRQAVYNTVASDDMPKKGPKCTAQEKSILFAWANQQAIARR